MNFEVTSHNPLGRNHTVKIHHQFAPSGKELRFRDLEKAAEIAPNTLSNRLEELTEFGLLTRNEYHETLRAYNTMEKTKEPASVFWYFGVWAERYTLEPISGKG